MRMGWNGRGYHLLAALVLVGGIACGSESDPGGSGHPLDGAGGTGGNDNGVGGHAGKGGNDHPGKGGKIDGGKGGFEGIGGLGGTLGNVAGSGGYGGHAGHGGAGGHGGEVNKGDACAAGEGLLVLRKDFCAPATNGAPGLNGAEGYENCKHVKSEDYVYISVNKVAPKEKLIWEGQISEAHEFWECVPVGDYVVAEDCSKLPQGVSCYDEYPVELKVKERKATKHTFINIIENDVPMEMGSITISKDYCLPVPQVPALTNGTLPYDCEAAKTQHEAYVEITDASTYGVVWSGKVSEGYPVKVDLPVGAYQVKEKCDALPPAFGCAYDAPFEALVEAWKDTPVELINLVYLETVPVYKQVEGCIYSTCDEVEFAVEVKKDANTPRVEYKNDGQWFSNDMHETWVSVAYPAELLLPRGSYVAKEKPAEAFKPKHAGGDMVAFDVPNGAVTFYNVFDKKQCHDGLDNEGNYRSDCAESACLENDYLGCSRDACYWSAYMEFKRVCNVGDTACMAADFYVEVESKNTIFGATPSFGASYLFEGGQGKLHIPAPCGTYAVRVIAPTGYVAHDEVFDLDVPSYYFPLKLYPPGGNVPEDPEEI